MDISYRYSRARTYKASWKTVALGLVSAVLAIALFSGFFMSHSHTEQLIYRSDLNSFATYDKDQATAETQTQDVLETPVWWFAPFLDHSSFGKEATQIMMAMSQSDYFNQNLLKVGLLQMKCVDQVSQSMDAGVHSTLVSMHQVNIDSAAIVVCHNMPKFFGKPLATWGSCETCPPKGMKNTAYTIARAMSETSRIPDDFVAPINSLDEVWVPTDFSKTVLQASGVQASKIHVVPPVVNTSLYSADKYKAMSQQEVHALGTKQVFGPASAAGTHAAQQQQQRVYKFLSVFKWETRKGWEVLLQAYLNEFSSQDDVQMYVVTKPFSNGRILEDDIQKWAQHNVKKAPDSLPPVYLITRHISDEQYLRLMASMHAFVLPTRGEGFGLPMVEAMSMALPVIATHYSGITEYLDTSVGYPITFKEVPVPEDTPETWFKGSQWAEPDVGDLQHTMRHVMSHREEAAAKGKEARQRIILRYSPEAMAKRLFEEFKRIEQLLGRKNQEAAEQ